MGIVCNCFFSKKSTHHEKKLILTNLYKCLFVNIFFITSLHAQIKVYDNKSIASFKQEVLPIVASKEKQVQEMVDMIFSFGELGFQEIETSKYITDILTKNGFSVEKGISNIPTAWMAKWGSGSPVIALGSDIDCIPKASQKPGVAYKDPIVEGAPGHGEGHNSGQAVIIYAAIAVKEIMQKNNISGTLIIWPGVAEELLGSKAWYVRDGYFKNVQTKDVHYIPFITDKDPAPIYLNKEKMDMYRSEMKKYYYDPSKYKTYMEQLGITYPTLEKK